MQMNSESVPDIESAAAVAWYDSLGEYQYAVVLDIRNGVAEIAPVFACDDGVKCYDDPDADRINDKDNVRLKDCPPPFSLLCLSADNGSCFVDASDRARLNWPVDYLRQIADRIDAGFLVSDRDIAEIYDHPFPAQMEKEKMFDVDTVPVPGPAASDGAHPPRSPLMSRLIDAAERSAAENINNGLDGPDF